MLNLSRFTQWNGLLCSSEGKEIACNAGDPGSVPMSGRSSGEWNGNLLQYFCLENPMDRGAWWAAVHEIAESGMTQRLQFRFSLSYIGKGNGNPLTESRKLH